MHGQRRTAAAAVAVLACLVSHAAPASARTAPTPLRATQELVGSAAASRAIVSLPRDVRLPGHADCYLSRTARPAGTAQQAAVVLTSLPLGPDSHIVWIAALTIGGQRRVYDSECLSSRIPSGQYLLQYVHSPGTSRLSLSLPGLSGHGTLDVRGRDRSRLHELAPVLPAAADSSVYSAGARDELVARGSVLTVGALAAGASDQGSALFGDCLQGPEAAVLPDAVAYAPGCPAGSASENGGATGLETWQATVTSNLSPASYGAGFWYAGTPTLKPLGAVGVWLTNGSAE